MNKSHIRVFIYGAGKLGQSLSLALRHAGAKVEVRAARAGLPTRPIHADLIVIAVRDRDIRPVAEAFAAAKIVPRTAVSVHVAGALDASPLLPLRAVCAGVAQMHPMIAFALPRVCPSLEGGNMHIQGDPAAVAVARRVARMLGMVPRTIPSLDTVGYHAAAGLVANGGAALVALGCELLVRSGVPRADAPKMLAPLLRSVADNVAALGMPSALTGPVRRGDAAGLRSHLTTLAARLPEAVPLYLEAARAQLPLARAIGDASAENFDAVARLFEEFPKAP